MFILTVAFQSISKRARNQFRESLRKRFPSNLVLANTQMVAYKFIEKDLHSKRFTWNKLNFLKELLSSASPRDVSRTPEDWEIYNNSSPLKAISYYCKAVDLRYFRLLMKQFFEANSNLRRCVTLPSRKLPLQIVHYVRKIFCRLSLA